MSSLDDVWKGGLGGEMWEFCTFSAIDKGGVDGLTMYDC